MINWQRYKIDINFLLDNKEILLKFSNSLNENAIRIIYANDKNYHEDWKMADHMVERFLSFGMDPAAFFSGAPGEQDKLRHGCKLNMESGHAYFVMEFFKYIKYSLGEYSVEMMFGIDYVNIWKTNDSINFFYLLTEEMQLKLLEQYNAIYDRM